MSTTASMSASKSAPIRPEVDDAGAQHEAARRRARSRGRRVRSFCSASGAAVERRSDATLTRPARHSTTRRDVSERRDAQALADRLELRVVLRQRRRARRASADVVGNHLSRARRVRPAAAPSRPSAPGSAREFCGPSSKIVERRLLVGLEVVVGRMVAERVTQVRRIANERAAGLERRVEPLVRIDRDRVGAAIAARSAGAPGRSRRERAVRAVDVEPESAASRQTRAISGSGSTAPVLTVPAVPTTRNGRWPAARSSRSCRRSASTSMRCRASDGDPAERAGAEPEEIRRFLNPGVCFGRQ